MFLLKLKLYYEKKFNFFFNLKEISSLIYCAWSKTKQSSHDNKFLSTVLKIIKNFQKFKIKGFKIKLS